MIDSPVYRSLNVIKCIFNSILYLQALEQDKYSLQREVELKARMLESLRSEFDLVKNQQKHQMEQQQTLLERSHALELSDLKNKVSLYAVFIFKSSMLFSSLYEAEFGSGFIHLPCFYPFKFKFVTFLC